MTPDDLARLKALCDKATPGPWLNDVQGCVGVRYAEGGKGTICTCPIAFSYHNGENDAAFIAAARSALPALIAEVKRLREELKPQRVCVTCGRTVDANDIPFRGEHPDCPTTEYGKLCMFDMTTSEAFEYWRQKWHEDFSYRHEAERIAFRSGQEVMQERAAVSAENHKDITFEEGLWIKVRPPAREDYAETIRNMEITDD